MGSKKRLEKQNDGIGEKQSLMHLYGGRAPGVMFAVGVCLATMATPLRAESLLETTTSWDGGAFAYPEGQAKVTAEILRIESGQQPPFHCHPVPTLGHVLRGVVEVETADGARAVLRAGDSVVEVMRTVHRGVALEAPVEILVFYAGASDLPTTVLPGDDPEGVYCDLPE